MRKMLSCLFGILFIFGQTNGFIQEGEEISLVGYDISRLEEQIAKCGAKLMSANVTEEDKKAAAWAYLARANVFYEAGQPRVYKYALGDFRRVLHLQPDNVEAKEKAAQIVAIYQSMERPVPENGKVPDFERKSPFRFITIPDEIVFKPRQPIIQEYGSIAANIPYWYRFSLPNHSKLGLTLTARKGNSTLSLSSVQAKQDKPLAANVTAWRGTISPGGEYLIKIDPGESERCEFVLRLTITRPGSKKSGKN